MLQLEFWVWNVYAFSEVFWIKCFSLVHLYVMPVFNVLVQLCGLEGGLKGCLQEQASLQIFLYS